MKKRWSGNTSHEVAGVFPAPEQDTILMALAKLSPASPHSDKAHGGSRREPSSVVSLSTWVTVRHMGRGRRAGSGEVSAAPPPAARESRCSLAVEAGKGILRTGRAGPDSARTGWGEPASFFV